MGSNENSFLYIEIVITLSKHLFSGYEEVPRKQKEAVIPPNSQAQPKRSYFPRYAISFHSCLNQVVYF